MSAAPEITPPNTAETQDADEKEKRGSQHPAFIARKWKPGQSGNPGGRPKSLATVIRERVGNDGSTLAEWFNRVRLGEEPGFSSRERLEAGKWLSAHGFGQPVSTQVNVQANDETTEAANALSSDQLETLARALKPDKP